MPNFSAIFKSEVSRIARKEVRAETESLKRSSTQYRTQIAALKRDLAELTKQLRVTSKAVRKSGAADAPQPQARAVRFSAGAISAHRAKVGLSAEAYGALLGVTGQSIYKWEKGTARPRAKQLEAWAATKSIGKREAAARLAELQK